MYYLDAVFGQRDTRGHASHVVAITNYFATINTTKKFNRLINQLSFNTAIVYTMMQAHMMDRQC